MKVFPHDWTTGRKTVVIGVVAVALLYGLSLAGSGDDADAGPPGMSSSSSRSVAATKVPTTYEVRYILKTSSAQNVRVVYNNATEGMERRESMPLSGYKAAEWKYQMERGTHAYISIDTPRQTPQSVSISCELLVNGERKDYTEAKGPSASVTCSAIVGR